MTGAGLALVLVLAASVGPAVGDVVNDARSLAASGDREAAAEAVRDALPDLRDEERPSALFFLASITEDWESSRDLLREIVNHHRSSPWVTPALVRLGEHALLDGDAAGARDMFAEAVDLAATDVDRQLALWRDAQSLLLLDQPGEARLRLRELLGQPGVSGSLRDEAELALAHCAYREGEFGDALRRSLDLLDRESTVEPGAALCAARALMARGESTLALEYFEQLGREFPDTADGALARAIADSLAGPGADLDTPASPGATSDDALEAPGGASVTGTSSALPDTSAPAIPGAAAGPETLMTPGALRPEDTEPGPRPWLGAGTLDDEAPADGVDERGPQSPGIGGFHIDLGEFDDRIGALRELTALRRRGVESAELSRRERRGSALYCIRIGGFTTRIDAEREMERLVALTGLGGVVEEDR